MTPAFTEEIGHDELATELYDMLMRDIEPDLLSYNLPLLDEYYKDETEEEHEERMKRYESAYEEFDVVFSNFMASVQEEARTGRRESLKEKEEKARAEEKEAISKLEQAFT